MAKLFRILSLHLWQFEVPTDAKDFPADPLSDIRTKKNTLSFYLAKDSNTIEDIILGLAANREDFKKFEYTLLDMDELTHYGAKIIQNQGDTASSNANSQHYELTDIKAPQLIEIARMIAHETITKNNFEHIPGPVIKNKIKLAIAAGKIKMEDVNPKLAEKLV